MPAKVLDSRALLAFFMDEQPAASRVEKIIKDAVRTDRNKVYLSAVGWSELYAGLERAAGQDMARETMAQLDQLPVIVLGVDDDLKLCRLAGRLQAAHDITVGAAFAAALAQDKRATLCTDDPQFEALKSAVRIEPLGGETASMTGPALGAPVLVTENSPQ